MKDMRELSLSVDMDFTVYNVFRPSVVGSSEDQTLSSFSLENKIDSNLLKTSGRHVMV